MGKQFKPELEIEWLEDLIAIEQCGSLTQAATKRGVTQSTLSKRIKLLEGWLGPKARVIERSHYPASLTETGKTLLIASLDITGKIRDIKNTIQSKMAHELINIHITSLLSLTSTHIPKLLEKIYDDSGYDLLHQTVDVEAGSMLDCIDSIIYGRSDFMLCYEHHKERIKFPYNNSLDNLEGKVVDLESFFPVCSFEKYDKFVELFKSNVPIPYLAYQSGTYLRNVIDFTVNQKLENLNQFNIVMELPLTETIRNSAKKHFGIGWVTESSAKNALARKEIVKFDNEQNPLDLTIPLKVMIYRNKDKILSSSAQEFWEKAGNSL